MSILVDLKHKNEREGIYPHPSQMENNLTSQKRNSEK